MGARLIIGSDGRHRNRRDVMEPSRGRSSNDSNFIQWREYFILKMVTPSVCFEQTILTLDVKEGLCRTLLLRGGAAGRT